MNHISQQSTHSYTDEAIAFLDIIGFKPKVEKTKTEPSEIAVLANALSKANEWLNKFRGDAQEIRTQTFSDTTLICCSQTDSDALVALATAISLFQCGMMLNGNVLRGALAVGLHYRSESIMFGPAMIEAYETEKLADWPRVLVAPSILERLNPRIPTMTPPPYFRTDNKGLTYIDYLTEGCLLLTAINWADQYRAQESPSNIVQPLLSRHRSNVLSLRDAAPHSNTDLSRCHALAVYHNETIHRLTNAITTIGTTSQNPDISHLGLLFLRRLGMLAVNLDEASTQFIESCIRGLTTLPRELQGLTIELRTEFPTLYGDNANP